MVRQSPKDFARRLRRWWRGARVEGIYVKIIDKKKCARTTTTPKGDKNRSRENENDRDQNHPSKPETNDIFLEWRSLPPLINYIHKAKRCVSVCVCVHVLTLADGVHGLVQ